MREARRRPVTSWQVSAGLTLWQEGAGVTAWQEVGVTPWHEETEAMPRQEGAMVLGHETPQQDTQCRIHPRP